MATDDPAIPGLLDPAYIPPEFWRIQQLQFNRSRPAALPLWDGTSLDELPEVLSNDMSNHMKDGVLQVPTEPGDAGFILFLFHKSGFGIPPFNRTVQATDWWQAETAATSFRKMILRGALPEKLFQRRSNLEDLAKPVAYRLNENQKSHRYFYMTGMHCSLPTWNTPTTESARCSVSDCLEQKRNSPRIPECQRNAVNFYVARCHFARSNARNLTDLGTEFEFSVTNHN